MKKIMLGGNTISNSHINTVANGSITDAKLDPVILANINSYVNDVTMLNLINPDTITQDYYVSNTTGLLVYYATFWTTDYIPILPETEYSFYAFRYLAYYDADKVFISGSNTEAGPGQATTPANAYFMRFSKTGSLAAARINIGATLNPYFPYATYYDAAKVYDSVNTALLTTTLATIKSYLYPTLYLNLPDTIYGVVGHEINIYFDNLVARDSAALYDFDVVCTVGTQQKERWTYTPESAATTAMTINVYDKRSNLLVKTCATSIVIKAAAVGTGSNKKLLVIGDSTTSQNVITGELLTLFGADVMDITLYGTQGSAQNLHEGHSGWTTATFVGATSPFYNSGAFDFTDYMSDQGYDSMDHVIINLGINDAFGSTTDAAAISAAAIVVTNLDIMIASIHAYSATIKIGIALTIPPASSQDAFGADYSSGQNRARYKRNNAILVDALITAYDGRAAEAIYVVPIHTNLDTTNNMRVETVAVNGRNATTIVRQLDGVHPDTSGYYQIADVMFNYLKSFET